MAKTMGEGVCLIGVCALVGMNTVTVYLRRRVDTVEHSPGIESQLLSHFSCSRRQIALRMVVNLTAACAKYSRVNI